jgi:hypothetical protein
MTRITGFLKAVFNFFVGDWIILGGVALTLALVALIENVGALNSLKGAGGYILFIGLIITLVVTLRREIRV